MNDIPIVKVFKCEHGKRYLFWCPYCQAFHRHGSIEGHRIAHCDKNSPFLATGYILREYTQKELKELELPLDLYNKHCK